MQTETEQDEADFYQLHKDDDEVWGEPIPGSRPKHRLASVVSVRFAPDELEQLRKDAPDGNVSKFIREKVLRTQANLETRSRLQAPLADVFPVPPLDEIRSQITANPDRTAVPSSLKVFSSLAR